MSIRIGTGNTDEMITIFIILFFLAFAGFIVTRVIKNSDNNKPIIRKSVKILEKRVSTGLEQYDVETSDGERLRLVKYDNKIIITAGDEGTLSYKGKTIVGFNRTQYRR